MISPLAIGDIEEIESRGGHVSPRDVVLLNALGLDITHNAECTLAGLPRVAIINGIMLREPTVKHEIFLDECARVYSDEYSTYLTVNAWTLAHDADELDDKLLRHPLMHAIRMQMWLKDKLGDVTFDELDRLIYFCKYGCDPKTNEYPFFLLDETDEKEDAVGGPKSWALARYLTAVTLDIDGPSALRATSGQLSEMIERKYLLNGTPLKETEKRATALYYKTLDEIKKRAFPDGGPEN